MNWIYQILRALLEWIEGLARKDTIGQDADPDKKTADALRDRIRQHESPRVQHPSDLRPGGDSGTSS